ncbi:MAG: hypothetical protein HY721_19145 [Planctomycetes bacterium]|nr:hypothetical protein [Planctomycetota bacterium]
MSRSFQRAVALIVVLVLGSAARAQEEPPPEAPPADPGAGKEDEAPAPAAREPEFKKDASKAEFEKAKGLYAEGKHKDAEALFKKVKGDARTPEDKDAVEAWVQAAGGAQMLERCKLRVKQKLLQQAYQETEGYLRRYKGTPIEEGFKALLAEIEAQIFVVVESFDTPSGEYTAAFGKTFVTDPKLLLDGTTCLRWTNTKERKAAALKVVGVPSDWSRIEALELWVNVTTPPPVPEAIIACGDPKAAAKKKKSAKKSSGAAPSDFYRAAVKIAGSTGRWQKVRIPLTDFQPQGSPSLASVTHFQIQLGAGRAFDFLIDKILLVKKEGAAGGGAGAEPKRKPGA